MCSNPGGTNSYNRETIKALLSMNDESSWLLQSYVYLYGRGITYLNPDCFTNLKNLTNLGLSSNNLTCLDASLFIDLINLQYLYLDNNHLTSLDSLLFNNLKSLNSLYLSSNQLTSLAASIFNNLTRKANNHLHWKPIF